MAEHRTDPSKLPALGRMMLWVDKPGSATRLFWLLAAACAVALLWGLTYEPHEHVETANLFGFYAIYGFLCFTFIIFAAKTLRLFVKRPEDYYGDKAVDREDYPADQLEVKTHDGL